MASTVSAANSAFRASRSCRTVLPISGPIARIDAVDHAKIGRPVGGAAAAVVFFVLQHRLLADFGRDLDQLAAGCFHGQLDFSGLQEMLHQDERLARALARRKQAVIVFDHGAIVAELGDEPLALPEVLGDAFVGVIADAAEERTASCEIMRSPVLRPAIAIPVRVCTCTAQSTSGRPRSTPPCSVKPGRLTPARSSRSSSMLTLTRFEAVTSVHKSSCRFIRNFRSSPGTRMEQ